MTDATINNAGDLRPRRSVLYMPAANARALEKAKTIPADALIFDLEDAVAPDAKPTARDQAAAAAASGEYGAREVTIRCNGLDTPWGADDLAAAAAAGPAAVVIPKVESVAYLADISDRLTAAGAPDSLRIWAMIETPTAIFDARDIAAVERVAVLDHGHQRPGQRTSSDGWLGAVTAPPPPRLPPCWRLGNRERSSSTASTTTSQTPTDSPPNVSRV